MRMPIRSGWCESVMAWISSYLLSYLLVLVYQINIVQYLGNKKRKSSLQMFHNTLRSNAAKWGINAE